MFDENFRRTFEAVPSGMILVDVDGIIVHTNKRAAEIFGFRREELIGACIALLVPERFRIQHKLFRCAYQSQPVPRQMGGGRDLIGLRKDGSEIVVEIGLSSLVRDAQRYTVALVTPL